MDVLLGPTMASASIKRRIIWLKNVARSTNTIGALLLAVLLNLKQIANDDDNGGKYRKTPTPTPTHTDWYKSPPDLVEATFNNWIREELSFRHHQSSY